MQEDAEFNQLYIEYFPRMVRFAQNYLQGRDCAENAVQDVFMKLYENSVLIPRTNRDAWFLAVVRNKCIDILRRARTSSLSYYDEKELEIKLQALYSLDDRIFSSNNLNDMIKAGLDSLPPRCREIFTMSKVQGLSNKQIASELGISTSTVENQITIAFKKLRDFYKNYFPVFLFFLF